MRLADRASTRSRGDPNVVPLINVVFLLLIFFILAGRLAPPERLPVELPASESRRSVEGSAAEVVLAADGRLAVAGEELARARLGEMVRGWLEARPNLEVRLKADRRVAARHVIEVLDALSGAGVERVLLLTRSGVLP